MPLFRSLLNNLSRSLKNFLSQNKIGTRLVFVENTFWQLCNIDKFFRVDVNFDTTELFVYIANKIKIFIRLDWICNGCINDV